MAHSYYSILEVTPNASEDDIRKAYRKKAKLLHPDINNSSDAHARFILLNKAYETLMDREKRHLYNHQTTNTYKDPFIAYQEWVKMQKAKAQYEEMLKHQKFLENREKFRNSAAYFPAKVLIFLSRIACYIFAVIVLLACFFVMYQVHFMMFFVLLPFLCGAIYFMKLTGDWYQEAKRYF